MQFIWVCLEPRKRRKEKEILIFLPPMLVQEHDFNFGITNVHTKHGIDNLSMKINTNNEIF